ncbi:hypothetical protein J4436_03240 [Candidatus Woesearchaeota archaeon]|nr:hypothetical protein [Candidatus Woesearchaeota archaeon]
MNKKLIVLSILSVVLIAAVVYAAFYKDVGVSLRVNEPLSSDIQNMSLLTVMPGETAITPDWEITNNGNEDIPVRVDFYEYPGTNICTRIGVPDPTCVISYEPVHYNSVTGEYDAIPTGTVITLGSGLNKHNFSLRVATGSELGTLEGYFRLTRI